MSDSKRIATVPTANEVSIALKLFAVARDFAGADTLELRLPSGATVGEVRAALIERVPAIRSLAPHLMFAVNAEYASDATIIPPGADVACIPPVSGG